MQTARDIYGVDPVVFLVIYLVCVPFFYYSLFRTFRALTARRRDEVMLWSAVFLGANVAPFLYVLFVGRNIPWWVYAVIVVLIGQGIFTLVGKLRRPDTAG
jgi:hypothetical protein